MAAPKLRNRWAPVKEWARSVVLKSVRLIVEFAIGAVIGVAIFLGLIVWRLSGEPVHLSFLTPYLEKAMSAEDGSFTTEMQDTVLTWGGWERALDIRLRGVRAIGPDHQVMAFVPEMSVGLSLRGLLRGVVAPTSLEVFHPKVQVVRGADGKFNFGFEDAGPAAGDIMGDIVTQLIAPADPARSMGYLTEIRITRAELTLVDEKNAVTWHAPSADVTLLRNNKGISGQAALRLDLGGEQAEIDADAGYDRDARKIDVGLTFGNLSPAKVAAKQKLFPGMEGIAVPVSGTLTGSLDIDGNVEVLGFDIAGGAGKLSLPKFYKEPLAVSKLALHGRLEDNLTRWVVDRMHADLGGPSLDIGAHGYRTGADLAAQGDVIIRDMPVDSLMRYWPETVAVNARTWIKGHIAHGNIPETHAVFAVYAPKGDLDALHLDSLAGTFDPKGLTVAYLPPMPAVENVDGRATFTNRELDIALTGGSVRGVGLTEGKVAITGLDVEDQDAAIEVVLQGPLRGVMEVLDSEPVGAAGFLGIKTADIGGQTAVRANFKIPLLKDLHFAQIDFGAAANIKGASVRQAALHQDLDSGTLAVKVDRTRVDANGTVKLGGVPASLAATLYFAGPSPPFRSRYTVSARPDETDLARFGFATAPYIVGQVPLSLNFVEGANDKGDLELAADLTETAMEAKDLGWSKAKGVPGEARIAMTLVKDRPAALREFNVTAGTLTAAGNGAFAPPSAAGDAASKLQYIDLTRLAFGRTDVAGRIGFRDDGGYAVDLHGPQIDALQYFSVKDAAKTKEKKKNQPPLSMKVAAATLWTGKDAKILNASLALDEVDDRWRSIDFTGALPNPDPKATENPAFRLAVAETSKANGRSVSLAAGDAGLFLKTFGLFDNMLGGKLNLDGTIDDSIADAPFTGRLLVKDYRITQVGFLAKLLTVASLTGIVNVLSGEGIGFTDLKAPMTYRSGILSITDARAYGPDLGLTMSGSLNIETNAANFQGTIVPAYMVNSILGNIPIVGDILTGGKGSGVFAATYTLTGSIADPDVRVNPLAAMTPGILRNLFDIFGNGSSDAKPAPDVQSPRWQSQ